ncbi:precorrin-2 dehydrogenase/sirohydrochlorin ferrochelatase family protein [Tepidicaulis sp.]|uniref:precorrin-2 dehydrogenase/sirohydrochlorin ferrochelatase family protein n=1 Tax=Tepidicaulis sp. TaxID=1920809 RepID=UPI003B59E7D6
MLPISLDLDLCPTVLVAAGEAGEKRLALLKAGGAGKLRVFSAEAEGPLAEAAESPEADLEAVKAARVVFVAGLPRAEGERLAAVARKAGALVNVEDERDLCDFHVPALVRRGDLILAILTGGKAPGMARFIRRYLERIFGPEWADRLDEVAAQRLKWRAEGLSLPQVSAKTERFIEDKGWLK